jgi:hypothetical protein
MDSIQDAITYVQQEDLIDQVALCYAAGCYTTKSIMASLRKMDVAPLIPWPDSKPEVLEAFAKENRELEEQVRALIAWPHKTEAGRQFWQRVDEAKDEVTALRALGKRAIKDAHRMYLGQRILAAESNEDKRTRASAQQYHLGAVGHSPSQKHEVTGGDDLLKLAREMFAEKKGETP